MVSVEKRHGDGSGKATCWWQVGAKRSTACHILIDLAGLQCLTTTSCTMTAFISTPFGDFDYVKSDLSRSTSCDQCCLLGLGVCNEVDCLAFDNDVVHYHLEPHYEIGGES